MTNTSADRSSVAKVLRTIAAAALAVVTVLIAVPPAQAAARIKTTGCATVTIIGARGGSVTNSQGSVAAGQLSGFGAESSAVARDAMNRFSAGTTVRYDRLIYPAALTYLPTYASSVSQGVARLKVQVAYFVSSCPSTKIVLIGFAEGAHVVHLAAAQLSPSTASHISRVVLIADPIRNVSNTTGTVPFNFGRPIGDFGNGRWGAGPVFTNGLQNGSRVASFCMEFDGYCNGKNAIAKTVYGYYSGGFPMNDMGKYLWSRLYQAGVR